MAARLRRERALLAGLDHPGLARLLDGGETADGVPYLVTEFVDGAPITDWADARDLGVRDRVRLVVDVARAVEHAHRRFVVHRDLKPSNVLVTERDGADGRPVARPVVLDFGVAKLVEAAEGGGGAAAAPLTRTGLQPMTPAYAAPELFEPAAVATTAADVYGLGAVLYELLTGARPHDDTAATGPPTTEPTRPSRRAAAGARPARRARALAGDLDTICLKALAADPARRYGSAAALADDLGRYLAGRPVEARPDSAAYVAGRFVRRHRAAVAGAAVAVAALVGGLGVALASLAGEREARAEAEAAALRAEQATDLLAGVFDAADPAVTGLRAPTVRDVLASRLDRVGAVADPALRGHLLGVLGRTYLFASDLPRADSVLAASIAALAAAPDAPLDDVAAALEARARVRAELGDYDRALALYRRAYAAAGADPDDDPVAYSALNSLAWLHRMRGRPDAAVRQAAVYVENAERSGDPQRLSDAFFEMAEGLEAAGRYEEAAAYSRRSVEASVRANGPDSRRTHHKALNLGTDLLGLGRTAEAAPLVEAAADAFGEAFGPTHTATADAVHQLGLVRRAQGRPRAAAALIDSALAVFGRRAPGSPRFREVARSRADLALDLADYGAAERAARAASAVPGPVRAPDLPGVRYAELQLGLALVGQGKGREGRPYLDRALAWRDGPDGGAWPADSAVVAAARRAVARGRGGAADG